MATAWEQLLPEYRSEFTGWSKSGDFYCPFCFTFIGRNLNGEKPFWHSSVHLKEAHGLNYISEKMSPYTKGENKQ